MKNYLYCIVSIAIISLTVGCGDGGIESDVEGYAGSINEAIRILCNCSDDPSGCYQEGQIPRSQIDCVIEVSIAHEEAMRPFVECAHRAAAGALSCVRQEATCQDPFTFLSCFEEGGQAEAACPQPPADIGAMFDACTEVSMATLM